MRRCRCATPAATPASRGASTRATPPASASAATPAAPASGRARLRLLSPRRQRHENGLIFTENFSHQAFSYVGGIHAYTIIPSYTKEIHLYGAL